MSKSLIATVSAVLAIAASLPVGAAKALPAQNGGGCNMVAGSAHGTGQGAANMFDLLASFSDDHCGLGG